MSDVPHAGMLAALSASDSFIQRHIGPGPEECRQMLEAVGATSLQALIEDTVPAAIHRRDAMDLPPVLSEAEALRELQDIAAGNQVFRSYIGLGYYDTHTPPVIQRNLLENPAWYTAYTPYQPEISQGRLEGLLNFQQMVMDLTGMELANASLLDEATAAAEAMALAKRVNKKNRSQRFFVADDCLPQTRAVLETRAEGYGFEIVAGDPETDLAGADVFGALLQYPGSDGRVRDLQPLIEQLHNDGALAVVAADLLALTLLTPPGEMDADVVVGNTQRFGVPLGYGGPHAAYMATRDRYKRSMPGRIIGVSVDRHGRNALRMAMQTREQHIRREKATSNICTSQALLAICAASYAVYHGPEGLTAIARRVHRLAQVLAAGLRQLGLAPEHEGFFDTLTVSAGDELPAIVERAEARGINLRRVDASRLGISLDETTTARDIAELWDICAGRRTELDPLEIDATLEAAPAWSGALTRHSAFLTHPVFHEHRSETELMRYLERLARKDIALNQSMIALGSCTMKLNAAAEMAPISWPAFARMHPFAPLEQAQGYRQLFAELEQMLAQSTGYAAVSLQPNAGSQGEYAGLLAIRRYLDSRGETGRDVCLIPSSAHGTNPASAAMAGMRVVIVECDQQGNVDLADLDAKIERHRDELAAIMVTYPSTHGVFEEGITELCEKVHAAGGQVYVDGANLNALVGIAAPGQFGADVSHLNLHKTFCIPHGGGGPGVGPIGVGEHLAPFLPGHPFTTGGGDTIAAAPWGSASILPISWMYLRMMGAEGLTRATQVAILNANYIATRLAPHYRILYTGRNQRVAHECIIDLRPLKEEAGVNEEDVAKRLIDFGFHAPTMSFPVPGTLMVEPTESESLAELDRFCEAMITIHDEAARISRGEFDEQDNPLRNAPHTAREVCADEWDHAYSRELAAYPSAAQLEFKYWPPVGRVDNVYGDRNLFCACPSIESWR